MTLAVQVDSGFCAVLTKFFTRTDADNAFIKQSGKMDQLVEMIKQLKVSDLEDMYHAAIAYIDSSTLGHNVLTKINQSTNQYTVKIGEDVGSCYDSDSKTIIWNPLEFIAFWTTFGKVGVVSPACVLLHEMGHLVQSLDYPTGYNKAKVSTSDVDAKVKVIRENTFEAYNSALTSWILEHHNLTHHELVFSKEKHEPIRDYYTNAYSEGGHGANRQIKGGYESEISGLFAGRANDIVNKGWLAMVTEHTQVKAASDNADHPDLVVEKYPADLDAVFTSPTILLAAQKRSAAGIFAQLDGLEGLSGFEASKRKGVIRPNIDKLKQSLTITADKQAVFYPSLVNLMETHIYTFKRSREEFIQWRAS